MEPMKHQYDFDAATVIGFLQISWARPGFQAQHRSEPRHPGRPHLPARTAGRRRCRTAGQHRCQPRRLPERLGYRPVSREPVRACRSHAGHPARRRIHDWQASTSTPRRGAIPPTSTTLFIAHITGMDLFARALTVAHLVLQDSGYRKMRQERYASFDSGNGKDFEEGRLTLQDLRRLAMANGEPAQLSGKQELYERILTLYM